MKAKHDSKVRYDKKADTNINFEVGSLVLVRDINCPKFSKREEVCKVVKVIDDYSFILRNVDSNRTFKCATARVSKVSNSSNGTSNLSIDFDSDSSEVETLNDDPNINVNSPVIVDTPNLDNSPNARCSNKIRRPPCRLNYYILE